MTVIWETRTYYNHCEGAQRFVLRDAWQQSLLRLSDVKVVDHPYMQGAVEPIFYILEMPSLHWSP